MVAPRPSRGASDLCDRRGHLIYFSALAARHFGPTVGRGDKEVRFGEVEEGREEARAALQAVVEGRFEEGVFVEEQDDRAVRRRRQVEERREEDRRLEERQDVRRGEGGQEAGETRRAPGSDRAADASEGRGAPEVPSRVQALEGPAHLAAPSAAAGGIAPRRGGLEGPRAGGVR